MDGHRTFPESIEFVERSPLSHLEAIINQLVVVAHYGPIVHLISIRDRTPRPAGFRENGPRQTVKKPGQMDESLARLPVFGDRISLAG